MGTRPSWQRYLPAVLATVGLGLGLWGLTLWALLGPHPATMGVRPVVSQAPAPPVEASPVVAETATPPPAPPLEAAGATGKTTTSQAGAADGRKAMEHIRYLSQTIGPRVTGSAQEGKAIAYVMGQLSQMGYSPKKQVVSLWDGRTSSNVIAVLPGNQHIAVVGAHLDSVAAAPGANDNASGVGVLLEVARHLSRHAPRPTVYLVVFCAEEGQYKNGHSVKGTGRHGSAAYVKSLSSQTKSRIVAMVNMDMVGAGPPKLNIGDMTETGCPPALRCVRLAQQLGIPAHYDKFGGKSDYQPFNDAGIPIVALAWGDDPSHHTPADKYSIVDPVKVRQTLRVVDAYLDDCR